MFAAILKNRILFPGVPAFLLAGSVVFANDLTSDLQQALNERFGSDFTGLYLSIDHDRVVTIAGHVESEYDEQRVLKWLKALDGVDRVITLITTD